MAEYMIKIGLDKSQFNKDLIEISKNAKFSVQGDVSKAVRSISEVIEKLQEMKSLATGSWSKEQITGKLNEMLKQPLDPDMFKNWDDYEIAMQERYKQLLALFENLKNLNAKTRSIQITGETEDKVFAKILPSIKGNDDAIDDLRTSYMALEEEIKGFDPSSYSLSNFVDRDAVQAQIDSLNQLMETLHKVTGISAKSFVNVDDIFNPDKKAGMVITSNADKDVTVKAETQPVVSNPAKSAESVTGQMQGATAQVEAQPVVSNPGQAAQAVAEQMQGVQAGVEVTPAVGNPEQAGQSITNQMQGSHATIDVKPLVSNPAQFADEVTSQVSGQHAKVDVTPHIYDDGVVHANVSVNTVVEDAATQGENITQQLSGVRVKIGVEPLVSSPADFVNSVSEQIGQRKAFVDVKPNVVSPGIFAHEVTTQLENAHAEIQMTPVTGGDESTALGEIGRIAAEVEQKLIAKTEALTQEGVEAQRVLGMEQQEFYILVDAIDAAAKALEAIKLNGIDENFINNINRFVDAFQRINEVQLGGINFDSIRKFIVTTNGDLDKFESNMSKVSPLLKDILTVAKKVSDSNFSNLDQLSNFVKSFVTQKKSESFNNASVGVATGLKTLIDALRNVKGTENGNAIVTTINDWLSKADELKNLATILKSTTKDIRIAQETLNRQNDVKISNAVAELKQAEEAAKAATQQSLSTTSKGVIPQDVTDRLEAARKTIQDMRSDADLTAKQVEKLNKALLDSQKADISMQKSVSGAITKSATAEINSAIKAAQEADKLATEALQQSAVNDKVMRVNSNLEKNFNTARNALEALKSQAGLTAEQIQKIDTALSSLNASKASRMSGGALRKSLEQARVNVVDEGFVNNTFLNQVEKLESGFVRVTKTASEANGKVSDLYSLINKMGDASLTDADRVAAYFDYVERLNVVKKDLATLNTQYSTNDTFRKEIDNAHELKTALDALDKSFKNWRELGLDQSNASTYGVFQKLKSDAEAAQLPTDELIRKYKDLKDQLDAIAKYQGKGTIFSGQVNDEASAMTAMRSYLAANGSRISKEITEASSPANGVQRWTAQLIEANGAIKDVEFTWVSATQTMSVSTQKVGQSLGTFASAIDVIKKKFASIVTYWTAMYLNPYRLIGILKQGVSVIREYDDALTEMRKVSDESLESLNKFADRSFKLADQVGSTGLQIQKSTADFLRLGENLEDAAKHAQEASILLNTSDFTSIDEATEAFISMRAAYKEVEGMDLLNKLNLVGNNFAISTSGAASALQRSAAALKTAGNDLDEALALVTAGNTIIQDPESAGSALRTIALRLTGTKIAVQELQD